MCLLPESYPRRATTTGSLSPSRVNTMPVYKTSAVATGLSVILTGVGPRNPMGLPTRPMGAKTPPTPPQPLSAAYQYTTPVLPGPNTGGYQFLPTAPMHAMVGQPPPTPVAPIPLTSRKAPTIILGSSQYPIGGASVQKVGLNVYATGPAPIPPAPTTPANPSYGPTQMPLMMKGSLSGG